MKFKEYWSKFEIVGWKDVMGTKNGRVVKTKIPIYKPKVTNKNHYDKNTKLH